ncbi:hypothetical protein PF010_g23231 [Phytophthora fragariae]|uniref:Uncharacterized protein n=1 Tax=Phytophthora fragariae TaxID=53985 RepID=A0A6G0N5N8_9STRA|nr:hypothetical protein PF010_g23231 [Phytophthora fragariae]KAE9195247.1 hypothetical protein PF004_g20483 [Phytophthora fragariae]
MTTNGSTSQLSSESPHYIAPKASSARSGSAKKPPARCGATKGTSSRAHSAKAADPPRSSSSRTTSACSRSAETTPIGAGSSLAKSASSRTGSNAAKPASSRTGAAKTVTRPVPAKSVASRAKPAKTASGRADSVRKATPSHDRSVNASSPCSVSVLAEPASAPSSTVDVGGPQSSPTETVSTSITTSVGINAPHLDPASPPTQPGANVAQASTLESSHPGEPQPRPVENMVESSAESGPDNENSSITPLATIRANFWNTGHTTVASFLSQDEVEMARRAIMRMYPRMLLRPLKNPQRRQALIDLTHDSESVSAVFRMVLSRFIELASNLHKSWSVVERLVVLDTLPDAAGEQLHRDFQSAETAMATVQQEWVQASFLLVLDEDTELIVVEEGFAGSALREKAVVLDDLQPGDLVVIRGDVPHAEAAFKERNLRIQGCVNVDGVDHDERMVEQVAWAFYRCKHCFKRCDSKRALSNHVRYCGETRRKKEIAKKRKINNDKGAYCEECDRHFGKKNTFDVHKCKSARDRDEA